MFEKSDILNSPIDCLLFDSEKETFPIRSHWHYFMELIYVKKGVITVNTGSNTYTVNPNEMIIFPPKVIHSINSEFQPVYYLLKFDINRIKNNSLNLSQLFNGATDIYPIICSTDCNSINAKEILENCILEMNNKKYGYTSIISSFVFVLLTRIIQIWKKENFEFTPPKFTNTSIYTIPEYIDAHLNEDLRVETLAKICNMSYSYFAKNFSELYLQSCKSFIIQMRINKACELLMFSNYDMNQIALELGFTDASHFIKAFSTIKKTTPKQYRISYLNGKL